MNLRLGLIVLTLAAAGLATEAEAQIYTWTDASGSLVLSEHPPAPGTVTRTFSVARSASIRVTRPAESRFARGYDQLIEDAARSGGVRSDLVRAVIQVESGFNPGARSSKGAIGLMQLMPATAVELGVRNPYDPKENVRGGVAYLRQLLTRYEENETLALAAYNAGPEAVQRYGNRVPPYRETREYVSRVQRTTPAATSARPVTTIYRSVEIVEGRLMMKYQGTPPANGWYDVIRFK